MKSNVFMALPKLKGSFMQLPGKLFTNTATPLLLEVLHKIMESSLFNAFRLVGGTALSLQKGHRISVDIDLFTDEPYGSVDILYQCDL